SRKVITSPVGSGSCAAAVAPGDWAELDGTASGSGAKRTQSGRQIQRAYTAGPPDHGRNSLSFNLRGSGSLGNRDDHREAASAYSRGGMLSRPRASAQHIGSEQGPRKHGTPPCSFSEKVWITALGLPAGCCSTTIFASR